MLRSVPQGESFCTVSRYCLTYIGPKTSHLRVSSEIRYPNGPPWAMIRSMIERNSYDGLRDYFEHLSTYMTEYIESADVSSLLDDTTMAPRVSVPPSYVLAQKCAESSFSFHPSPSPPPSPPPFIRLIPAPAR